LLGGLFLLAACVTINIYFPAAQAEEAAERIVDDILGKEAPTSEQIKDLNKGTSLPVAGDQAYALRLLDFFIPTANAAEPDFNVSSPAVRKLQARMKQRNRSLTKYYASGGIGFTRDALVAIHDTGAIPLKERNRVKKLVSAENRDRQALYKAIAQANGHPEWEPDIRATFARTWVSKAAKGSWYQKSNGRWSKK
jgi:uncharacterized protein YdbL (DUF1318 family)